LESFGQRHQLGNIRHHRGNTSIISKSIQNDRSLTSFDVQDSFIVFPKGALPHLGTSLGTQKESQQFGEMSNLEVSPFREVIP